MAAQGSISKGKSWSGWADSWLAVASVYLGQEAQKHVYIKVVNEQTGWSSILWAVSAFTFEPCRFPFGRAALLETARQWQHVNGSPAADQESRFCSSSTSLAGDLKTFWLSLALVINALLVASHRRVAFWLWQLSYKQPPATQTYQTSSQVIDCGCELRSRGQGHIDWLSLANNTTALLDTATTASCISGGSNARHKSQPKKKEPARG